MYNERRDNNTWFVCSWLMVSNNYRLRLFSRILVWSSSWLVGYVVLFLYVVCSCVSEGGLWMILLSLPKFVTVVRLLRSAWFPQWICINVKYLVRHAYICCYPIAFVLHFTKLEIWSRRVTTACKDESKHLFTFSYPLFFQRSMLVQLKIYRSEQCFVYLFIMYEE